MTSLLLIISFLLHVIAFYIIYKLYNQLQKNHSVDEITGILEQYLDDIKKENKRLQREISRPNLFVEQTLPINQSNSKKMETNNENELVAPKIDLTEEVEKVSDSLETSLDARVIQLYKQGLSITDIAKQLNCGKTEAELIIKFYKKSFEEA